MNADDAISEVKSKLSGIPLPSKPKTFGKEYSFPDDFSQLSGSELAGWLSKLAGWEGYTMRLLSEASIEKEIMQDSFEAIIGKATFEYCGDKKYTKDLILGKVIIENEAAKSLKVDLIKKNAETEGLKRLVDLYTIQMNAVSREISRRGNEIQALQKGLSGESGV